MASYKRLIENYERKEKELNATLVAFYLQTGHLMLSGKTEFNDDECKRPYELIAAEISSINDQCREITSNERRRNELEKSVSSLKKSIQNYDPEKRIRLAELGSYLFDNYTQHFAATFGSVYQFVSEEKKSIRIIEGKLVDIEDQLENKDFFSKLVVYVRQSSLKSQLANHNRKLESLLAEGAEKAFKAGVVNAENGGTAYSAYRILQEEIDSITTKLDDAVNEIETLSEKLKEADKKHLLLAIAADKAGELDKLAETAGARFVNKYVSAEADILGKFPESYSRIFSDVVETRKELCSIARRKEMLHYTEQIDNAAGSIDALNREKALIDADIERLTKRKEELSERIEASLAAVEDIKQRKIALEVKEGISVSRLLGAATETQAQTAPASEQAEPVSEAEPVEKVVAASAAAEKTGSDKADSVSGAPEKPDAPVSAAVTEPAPVEKPAETATKTRKSRAKTATESSEPAKQKKSSTKSGTKAKASKTEKTPKTAKPAADGEKSSSASKAAAKKGKADKATKNGKDQSKLKNTKPNGEVSTST